MPFANAFRNGEMSVDNANLSKSLWTYAVKASANTRNRCFNRRLDKTDFDAKTNKRPNVSNMHTFGQTCFALINSHKKTEPKGRKKVFLWVMTQAALPILSTSLTKKPSNESDGGISMSIIQMSQN